MINIYIKYDDNNNIEDQKKIYKFDIDKRLQEVNKGKLMKYVLDKNIPWYDANFDLTKTKFNLLKDKGYLVDKKEGGAVIDKKKAKEASAKLPGVIKMCFKAFFRGVPLHKMSMPVILNSEYSML